MADLPSDVTFSSGSEYDVNKDLTQGFDSSDEEDFLIRRSRGAARPKKTRFEDLPSHAKSTPRDDIYAFTGEDENQEEQFIRKRVQQPRTADWQNTPTTTAQKTTTLEDLMKKMTDMETTLLSAIGELKTDNENLRKQNDRRATQIDELSDRVAVLERQGLQHPDREQQTKASNHVRAALRTALKHAEEEKGMEIQVHDGIDAPCNKKIVEYIKTFSKVQVPDMTDTSFRCGVNTILRSKKQQASRQRGGRDQYHSLKMRKIQRKTVKSQNRVRGLETCDLPGDIKKKYRSALKRPALMSSEESDINEDGDKVLKVRKREWESHELRRAKRIADRSYTKTRTPKTPRLRRVAGPLSTSQAPGNLPCGESWTVVDYGNL